jgi:folate-binding protein YgfZ
VAAASSTGAPGYRIFVPAGQKSDLLAGCESAGAVGASDEDARIVRLEYGKPRYGEDITANTLPQETGLADALSFTKGCYLGQEIVERIRSRGHVNRLLVRLEWEGAARGGNLKMHLDGNEVGQVTSFAQSPALGKVVALGYARAQFVKPGAGFDLEGGLRARVTGPAPTLEPTDCR